jgi:hypothetical protein
MLQWAGNACFRALIQVSVRRLEQKPDVTPAANP